jgi:hypothetical protein
MKYFFICFSSLLLFSCLGNKKENDTGIPLLNQETEQSNSQDAENNVLNVSLSIDEIREFIYKNDEYIRKYSAEIEFIEKANLGITGGDNWIIRLKKIHFSYPIFIYSIKGRVIVKSYNLTSFNLEGHSTFDIMLDIPGTHIGNSTSSFGDFNGDGIDEIFEYGFYGRAFEIIVWGYDAEKDDFVSFCEIPFKIIDPENGPAPVEFMTYKGMYGFKVCFSQSDVAGGPDYISEPDPKNGKWFFYTWDAEQRKYVEIGEVTEEDDVKSEG